MAQAAVVPSAPGVQLPLSSDGRAVGAPARDVHHVLPALLAGEGRDHLGLIQGPVGGAGRRVRKRVRLFRE